MLRIFRSFPLHKSSFIELRAMRNRKGGGAPRLKVGLGNWIALVALVALLALMAAEDPPNVQIEGEVQMKRYILMEVLRRLQGAKVSSRRKSQMKWILGGAGVFVVAVVGLFIWASVATISFVVGSVKSVTPENVRIEVPQINPAATVQVATRCWDEAQTFLNWENWLNRPLGESFLKARQDLSVACGVGSGAGTPGPDQPSQLHEAKAVEGHI